MNSRLLRRSVCGLLAALLLCAGPAVAASSQSVTPNYQYNADKETMTSPAFYEVEQVMNFTELGLETYGTISDQFMDEEGILHLLDFENGNLIQLDSSLKYLRTLTFTMNGEEYRFTNAGGLFVRGTGEDKIYYIADGDRGCVVMADAEGTVLRQMTRPDSNLISDSLVFSPQKVVVNDTGVVYTIIPQLYMGAVTFSPSGEFLGFYGSNKVEVTARLLLDQFWKKLLNNEQADKLAQYVPVEYSNLDIDSKNFVYTVTSANSGNGEDVEQIKKINAKNVNILKSKQYGDLEYYWDSGVLVDTSFVDVAVLDEGMVVALDATRGRVFMYSETGEMLGVFGGLGEYRGTFRLPVAVDSYGRDVFVLDQTKQSITRFAPTDFGELVLSAVLYTQKGQFEKAYEKWQQVAELDAGSELAYVGIGKMLMQDKKYAEAAEAFRLGNDKASYSEAFGYYRNELLNRYFGVVFVVLCLAIAAFFVIGTRIKGRKDYDYTLKNKGVFAKLRYTLFHPIDGMEIIKTTVSPAKQFAVFGIVAASWLLISVISFHGTGFAFNMNVADSFSIWGQLAQTVVVMIGFVIANWFVCVMTNGSGKLCEIATVTSIALIPFLMFQLLNLILSNVLTIEESGFVWVFSAAFYIWAAVILLLGLQNIHEFTFSRNLFTLFATLAGMLIMVFLAILVWSLMQQVASFVVAVVDELTLLLR